MKDYDLTSWYGTQQFIEALMALDGAAGAVAEEISAAVVLFAAGHDITVADISAAGDVYAKKLEEVSKLWKNNGQFDPATIKSLVDSEVFSWDDFDLATSEYVGNYEEFLTQYLGNIETQIAEAQDSNYLGEPAATELDNLLKLIATWKNNLLNTAISDANKTLETTLAQKESNAKTDAEVQGKIYRGDTITQADYAKYIGSLGLVEETKTFLNKQG
jgi:ABC-type transporter MlaC component